MSNTENVTCSKDEEVEAVDDTQQNVEQKSPQEILQEQDIQFQAKYPNVRGAGTSAFLLQRQLSKGTKYFDSGDYNMAKAKISPTAKLPTAPPGHKLIIPALDAVPPTGNTIPTPETVPHRKASLQQSKLVSAN